MFIEILRNGTIASFIQPLFEWLAGIQRFPQHLLIDFIGGPRLPMISHSSVAGRPVRCIDDGLGSLAASAFSVVGSRTGCNFLCSRLCDLSPVGRGCGPSSVTATRRLVVVDTGIIGTLDILFADSFGIAPRGGISYTGHSHVSLVIVACHRFALGWLKNDSIRRADP
jgi:hypothetical protein